MIGWGVLGGQLHYWGHEAALRFANEYIQRTPGTCGCGICGMWIMHTLYSKFMPAVIYIQCVCSSAFVDYTDAHTDHICAHVHLHTHPYTHTHTSYRAHIDG